MLEAIVYITFCALTGLCGIDRRMGFFGTFFSGAYHHSVGGVACACCSPALTPRSNGVAERRAIVLSDLASACLAEPATAFCGSVDGRHHAYVLPPARSPRNARLAAEAAVHVRPRRHQHCGDSRRHQCRPARRSERHKPGLWAATLFMVSLFLFIKTQSYVTITTTAEIEAIIHKIRLRLMDQVRRSELLSIEGIGRSRIVAAITSDTAVLTQASNMLCFTVQGAVLILFCGNLCRLSCRLRHSPLTIVIVSIAATIFHFKNCRLVAEKQRAAEWERRLFDRLTDFLDGFKEVRLNSARSADLVRRRC